MRSFFINIAISLTMGVFGAFIYNQYFLSENNHEAEEPFDSNFTFTKFESTSAASTDYKTSPEKASLTPGILATLNADFVEASNKSTSSVVFIQTMSEVEYRTGNWMDWFFEPRSSQRSSSGSGVIFSSDGYIVTNNHVISEADVITVIHGKETYTAEYIGNDPSTDLAVIKISGQKLPAISLGNSQELKVGEWVLAVGNPFNLTSTVTAGIVSAKGRNINILRDRFPLESFIQTDAAINPGNSGGALVNTRGELVGINTAILSQTGSYTGYGFAVPVDIVKKVFNDIKTYGEVQKAFLGAEYIDVDFDIKEKMALEAVEGVIVIDVQEGWAADKAKVKKGDIIIKADGTIVDSRANLEELIGYKYPGDEVLLTLKREGKTIQRAVTLTNREATTDIIRKSIYFSESLGATFEAVPLLDKEMMGISSGVRVASIKNGFFKRLEIPQGFIITQINNAAIDTPEELASILEKIRGRVIISGVDKRGRKVYYPFVF